MTSDNIRQRVFRHILARETGTEADAPTIATAAACVLAAQPQGAEVGLLSAVRWCAEGVSKRSGIQGMRERVRQLDGTFGVALTDTGSTVRVRVPIDRGTT